MTLNVAESKKCNKCTKKNKQTKNPQKTKSINLATVILILRLSKLIQICTVIMHVNDQ